MRNLPIPQLQTLLVFLLKWFCTITKFYCIRSQHSKHFPKSWCNLPLSLNSFNIPCLSFAYFPQLGFHLLALPLSPYYSILLHCLPFYHFLPLPFGVFLRAISNPPCTLMYSITESLTHWLISYLWKRFNVWFSISCTFTVILKKYVVGHLGHCIL